MRPGSITHPVTVTNPPPEYALDAFGRTVANGLGTADIGGPWTLTGAASNFSVAKEPAGSPVQCRWTAPGYLNSVQQRNIDFTTDVTIDHAATGGGAYVSVIGRRVSQGNDYRLIVRYLAGGSVQVLVARTVGGTQTVLANVTPAGLTVVPGDVLRARLVINGTTPTSTTVTAKVWRASSPEPAPWLLTATDSTAAIQSPGGVGMLIYVSGSWTGTAPVLSIDNLRVRAVGLTSDEPAWLMPPAAVPARRFARLVRDTARMEELLALALDRPRRTVERRRVAHRRRHCRFRRCTCCSRAALRIEKAGVPITTVTEPGACVGEMSLLLGVPGDRRRRRERAVGRRRDRRARRDARVGARVCRSRSLGCWPCDCTR